MMYDGASDLGMAAAIPPSTITNANTPYVSAILDCKGKHKVTLALLTGAITDADATLTTLLEESDAANMSGANTVAAGDMIGTAALASATFADDGEPRKLGYKGAKRYIRATVTPALNDAGAISLAGLWLFEDNLGAEPNPPV